jgi:hypothetical protein
MSQRKKKKVSKKFKNNKEKAQQLPSGFPNLCYLREISRKVNQNFLVP